MSNKYPGGIITSGANAGYSVAFDGTANSYLTVPDNTAFDIGAGDFVVECWVYLTASTDFGVLLGQWGIPRGYALRQRSGKFQFTYVTSAAPSTEVTLDGTTSYALNTWYYVAAVRTSNTLGLFVNGTREASASMSGVTINNSTDVFSVARAGNAADYTTGYISNARVIKGTVPSAYSATATSMVVPTQLLNVTNTSILTCNSPALVDQSSNSFTITSSSGAKVSTFTPFQGYVAYNPALGAATPGIWSVSDAIQAAQTRRWNMYDPYFNLTTLLLHGNYTGSVNSSGTAVYQNNDFLDSSSNNFTITRNGNPTQGTFSPFSQTGWSNYFASSSGFRFADSADFSMGTNAFTIECFVYLTKTQSAGSGFISQWVDANDSNSSWQLGVDWSGGTGGNKFSGQISIGGTVTTINDTTNYALNTWHHVVLCRSGSPGTTALFVNGVRVASSTVTGSIVDATNPVGIGVRGGSDSYYQDGVYISNVRVVNGTDVYGATNTTLTVPTAPLTAVTNTKLLTCQSNRFLDTNTQVAAKAVSQVLGTPSVQAFSPFLTNIAYTPTNQGGSGYFDGTTDYLVASGAALDTGAGTSDVTFECWVYNNGYSGSQYGRGIFTFYKSTDYNNNRLMFRLDSASNKINCFLVVGGSLLFGVSGTNSTASATPSAWTHLALVRSSQTFKLYINGALDTTLPATTASLSGFDKFDIGRTQDGTVPEFNGNMAGFRYLKGTAQYTAAFTPPTAPPTAITNTQLLLNYTNAGITDATAKNVFETVGNAQISTTQSKFGGTSMYFDGAGYLKPSGNQQLYRFGTGDFTVEMWVYLTSYGTNTRLYDGRPAANGPYLAIQVNTGGFSGTSNALQVYVSSAVRIDAGVAVTLNSWFHLAVCRSGTSTKMFVNGTQSGSTYTDSTDYSGGNAVPTIGASEDGNNKMSGYIADLRISRYARYTANFTPQTSQWQDQ